MYNLRSSAISSRTLTLIKIGKYFNLTFHKLSETEALGQNVAIESGELPCVSLTLFLLYIGDPMTIFQHREEGRQSLNG